MYQSIGNLFGLTV